MRRVTKGKSKLIVGTFLVVLLFVLMPVNVSAVEPVELWKAEYSGTGNRYDRMGDMAVDSKGNVFVTGKVYSPVTGEDMITIKYDTSGNQEWVRIHNGPGNWRDHGNAIAFDSDENILVAGHHTSLTNGNDYFIIKYDQNGNTLWTTSWDGPTHNNDWIIDITTDSSGFIYATGMSYSYARDFDIVTIKYDSAGTQLWEAWYDGPGSSFDGGREIVVDGDGIVYITGDAAWERGVTNIITIKYDKNGNEVWRDRYTGGGTGYEACYNMVLDSADKSIIVSGWSYGANPEADCTLIKYDYNGNILWTATYNGPGDGRDNFYGVTTDSSGNIYVTGRSVGAGTGFDMITAVYDSSGTLLWNARHDGPASGSDGALSVSIDALRNVYVTGTTTGVGTGSDYTTVAYDSSGTELWAKRFVGPGTKSEYNSYNEWDPEGHLVVAGWSNSYNGDYSFITMEYEIPPTPPKAGAEQLISSVESMNLDEGTETSLTSKLDNAVASIEKDRPSAEGQLGSFVNEVEALEGNKLSEAQADELTSGAQMIIESL
jgi:outer membrane protein assembly factor BamB